MYWWIILAGFISNRLIRFYTPPNYAISVTNIHIGNTGESNKDNSADTNLPDNMFGLPEGIFNLPENMTEYNLNVIVGKPQKNKINRKYSYGNGDDERFPTNHTDVDDFMILNITKFINQMNLLTLLESKTVGVNQKMDAIKQYERDNNDSGYVTNLKAGGLLKDW